jgi:glyoxylase-like metal-dependent hydrolase (beta-lactamase superfamily II)
MELNPSVEIIQTEFFDRPLNLPLVVGQKAALIDTGLVGTPAESIVPALATRGLKPMDLSLIIITHAHADHFGGNEELWRESEKAIRFAAHGSDQAWIEDPPGHTRQAYGRFVELGLMSPAELENTVVVSGNGVKLDYVLDGGEVFDLGDGIELEIVAAPGHTFGNICVLDRKNKILIQGETVAGKAQYNVKGELLTVPFYEDVELYLKTVANVARLDFEMFVPSHLALMNRDEAARFFEESLDFALRFEWEVKRRLGDCDEPVTVRDLWRSMENLWGVYPADLGLYMLLESHLKGLLRRGRAGGSLAEGVQCIGPHHDDLSQVAAQCRAAIAGMRR